jgi:tetratricopeptide (TPR) repeat protein
MSVQFPFLHGEKFDGQNADLLQKLETGNYGEILASEPAQKLFSVQEVNAEPNAQLAEYHESWNKHLSRYLESLSEPASRQALLLVGQATLQAFLQSNVTGPPLDWKPTEYCVPIKIRESEDKLHVFRRSLISGLSRDGEAAYQLTPHIELFYAALVILNHDNICGTDGLRWARVRANFWHQRMLNEFAPSLQDSIYSDLAYLEGIVLGTGTEYDRQTQSVFLLERTAIHTFHGFDKKARADLDEVARLRGFEYRLTGRLGKRTKFQQNDITQLVVLAKSKDEVDEAESEDTVKAKVNDSADNKPAKLDLNDDTLLESIAFTKREEAPDGQEENLPSSLAELDPSKQPKLHPLDAILLLSYASSITNTSPEDGLTREETLPYATRVLDGGSSNWQIYTQALLVRSRIEGYRSRTIERGVLQLQALVDQVIAETTGTSENVDGEATTGVANATATATFLPRPKTEESAPISERLMYINQLVSPPRWSLEAELAHRWVTLGGLRTALEIYERLELWAEAALCWAATDREDKARNIARRQLYQPGTSSSNGTASTRDETGEQYHGEERKPLPADAPRLLCILGDIENSVEHYERAWEVSGQRYARAQRSLGKHYMTARDMSRAEGAYAKSLKANPQNAGTWFTLGCVRLELRDWTGAVNAFSRTVSSEPDDAEAWSNLAAALMRLPANEVVDDIALQSDDPAEHRPKADPQKHVKEAFVAFKRAATLKRDSHRIWQNVLNVAATISPPPYADVIVAQQRLIELRSDAEGEECIDIEVMEALLNHVVTTTPPHSGAAVAQEQDSGEPKKRHGLERTFTELVNKQIVPLITRSRRLWQMVARLSLHLNRPSSALDAYEKAWRLTLNQPGWDDGSEATASPDAVSKPEKVWEEVVDATIELVDAYESLGEREVTEGLAAGSGELVCKNWRYKGRMAVRSVISRRAKAGLEGTELLKARMEDLKS